MKVTVIEKKHYQSKNILMKLDHFYILHLLRHYK